MGANAGQTPIALLVDTDGSTRQANQQSLENQGYRVVVAGDEAEALGLATRSAPSSIFIHVPAGRPGALSLIQALRANDSSRHIPVVVLKDQPKVRTAGKELKSVQRDMW